MSVEQIHTEMPRDFIEQMFLDEDNYRHAVNAHSLAQLTKTSWFCQTNILPDLELRHEQYDSLDAAVRTSEGLFEGLITLRLMLNNPKLANRIFQSAAPFRLGKSFYADFRIPKAKSFHELSDEAIIHMLKPLQEDPRLMPSEFWQIDFIRGLPIVKWPAFVEAMGPLLSLVAARVIFTTRGMPRYFGSYFLDSEQRSLTKTLLLFKFACATKNEDNLPFWTVFDQMIAENPVDDLFFFISEWQKPSGQREYLSQIATYLLEMDSQGDDLHIFGALMDLLIAAINHMGMWHGIESIFQEIIHRHYTSFTLASWTNFLQLASFRGQKTLPSHLQLPETPRVKFVQTMSMYYSEELTLIYFKLQYKPPQPYSFRLATSFFASLSKDIVHWNLPLSHRIIHDGQYVRSVLELLKILASDPLLYSDFSLNRSNGLPTIFVPVESSSSFLEARLKILAYFKILPYTLLFDDVHPPIALPKAVKFAFNDKQAAVRDIFTNDIPQSLLNEICAILDEHSQYWELSYSVTYDLLLEKHKQHINLLKLYQETFPNQSSFGPSVDTNGDSDEAYSGSDMELCD